MPFRKSMAVAWLATAGLAAIPQQAFSAPPTVGAATPRVRWPAVQSRVPKDAAIEARIDQILSRMSIEEKVGQIIQPDIGSVTPEDVQKYKLGSILAGGNSSPEGDEKAPPADWLRLADAFWEAAMAADWEGEKIPIIWGIDAVHGHANVVGATVFPHNIGLGATRNPELIRKIGEVTGRARWRLPGSTGTFRRPSRCRATTAGGGPMRAGRKTRRSPGPIAGPMVEGLQGRAGTPEFLGPGKVIATAKHFVGDGGTTGGRDQGDNPSTRPRNPRYPRRRLPARRSKPASRR